MANGEVVTGTDRAAEAVPAGMAEQRAILAPVCRRRGEGPRREA
jgi:hypothetical protein